MASVIEFIDKPCVAPNDLMSMLNGPLSLNLFPTENRMSPMALRALSSDATHRYQYSEGEDSFYGDTGSLTEMVLQCEQLAKTYFGAEKAFVNGLSGLNTMRWVLMSLAPPSGVIYIVEPRHGGHYATETICREQGYQVEYVPYDVERCEIDCDAFQRTCKTKPADLVYLDLSTQINLPSIPKIREAVGEDTIICFDASQVLALVPDNLSRIGPSSGMDVLNGSTHKTMPGPQKGLALTNREEVSKKLEASLPYHVSNPHVNAVGALAITFAEMMPCRRDYARAIKDNARSLASFLHSRGFSIAGADFGFTETQQVWIEPPEGADAIAWGHLLKDAHIRSTVVPLPSTGLPGLRIGVQEITRMGMNEQSMEWVADILERRLLSKIPAERIKAEVADLVRGYTEVQFVGTTPMPRSA